MNVKSALAQKPEMLLKWHGEDVAQPISRSSAAKGAKSSDGPIMCAGSACMGWRWASKPVLEKVISINSQEAAKILGVAHPANFMSIQEQVEFDSFMESAATDSRVKARLSGVGSDWELVAGPFYDAEDFIIYARYARKLDPNATGYCGMAGVPDGARG